MKIKNRIRSLYGRLPARLRPCFWDFDFSQLRWQHDRDLIIGRILAYGDWDTVRWLRRRLGDQSLRDWLRRRSGGGLSPPQLRYWELVLNLPRRTVNRWLAAPSRQAWDRRRRA